MKANQANDSRYRAAELGALLARHYPEARPHMIARAVFDMQAAARMAVRHEVNRCNYPMPEAQELRGYNRLRKVEAAINAALADLDDRPVDQDGKATDHATVKLGGDPRGACASLLISGSRGDGFGDGFSIY